MCASRQTRHINELDKVLMKITRWNQGDTQTKARHDTKETQIRRNPKKDVLLFHYSHNRTRTLHLCEKEHSAAPNYPW